jgi:hypothetical protein
MPEERGSSLTISLFAALESLRDLGVNVDEFTAALAKMSLLSVVRQAAEAGGEKKAIGQEAAGEVSQDGARQSRESLGDYGDQTE